MTITVQKIFKKRLDELEDHKALLKKIADMAKCIEAVQHYEAEAIADSKSAAKPEQHVAEQAVELALMLADSALEYAKEAEDTVKEAQFNLSLRDFNNVPGTETVARLAVLVKNLKAVESELKEWDVTAEDINRLDQLAALFDSQLADPCEVTVIGKSYHEMVRKELGRLRKIIKSTDSLMNRSRDTRFLMQYVNARIVADHGGHKTGKSNNFQKLESQR